ncbi:unnamed protein product [Ixodes persulcatus]
MKTGQLRLLLPTALTLSASITAVRTILCCESGQWTHRVVTQDLAFGLDDTKMADRLFVFFCCQTIIQFRSLHVVCTLRRPCQALPGVSDSKCLTKLFFFFFCALVSDYVADHGYGDEGVPTVHIIRKGELWYGHL